MKKIPSKGKKKYYISKYSQFNQLFLIIFFAELVSSLPYIELIAEKYGLHIAFLKAHCFQWK